MSDVTEVDRGSGEEETGSILGAGHVWPPEMEDPRRRRMSSGHPHGRYNLTQVHGVLPSEKASCLHPLVSTFLTSCRLVLSPGLPPDFLQQNHIRPYLLKKFFFSLKS